MNAEAKSGKPFFNHWMTVSNHRPFTYPDGRIDIPGTAKSREGGVKYTDYLLNCFLKWLKNRIGIKIQSLSLLQTTVLPVQEKQNFQWINTEFLLWYSQKDLSSLRSLTP
jgi:phosphoglycerol transferase MdoB-like AlkP superfamily enzyme